ncbi:HupE/UreJ family protein [Deinococcus depolymerans]|uniref:HupE/UreJ family protein n=1 Tax=Deinococcus depolymerans TaxID=392408 RepID=A0ABP3MHW7_9DEIO
MRRVLRSLLVVLLALIGVAGAHSLTFSQVDVHLNADATRLTVTLPRAALTHDPAALPAGTTDASLQATPLPQPVTQALTRLVTARLHVRAAPGDLPLTVTAARAAGENVTVTLTAPAATGTVTVQTDLFPDDTLHKTFLNLYRAQTLAGQYALDHDQTTATLEGPRQSTAQVVLTFIREGVHHIFIGPDHILFVLALVLLGGRTRTQVKIVTAFTAAHSVTLALATLNAVQLPDRLVESVIALSIVVVGLHDLRVLRRTSPRVAPTRDPRAALAFAFGLIHGFGFASVLREQTLPADAATWSLAAFNVGVEVGQLCILLVAAAALHLLRRAGPHITRTSLRVTATAITATGGVWFLQRLLT